MYYPSVSGQNGLVSYIFNYLVSVNELSVFIDKQDQ